MGLVPNASEHGYLVDHMLEFCHWFMVLLFVGWTFFFLYTIVRFHERRNPQGQLSRRERAKRPRTWSSVSCSSKRCCCSALRFRSGESASGRSISRTAAEALRVRAIGEQFAWNFHYPGPDGVFGNADVDLVSGNNPLGIGSQ